MQTSFIFAATARSLSLKAGDVRHCEGQDQRFNARLRGLVGLSQVDALFEQMRDDR